MAQTLALFDFDKTLYAKDSLLEFTRFHKGRAAFLRGLFLLFPWLVGLKLRLIGNEKVKQRYFSHFFANTDAAAFIASGKEFALRQMERNLDQNILQKFREHRDAGHTVYIVTASFPEWIAPWSETFGVKVIGTKAEISNGKISGKFASANCFGPEKVRRIKEILQPEDFDTIFVYGSGKGDREMLQLRKS